MITRTQEGGSSPAYSEERLINCKFLQKQFGFFALSMSNVYALVRRYLSSETVQSKTKWKSRLTDIIGILCLFTVGYIFCSINQWTCYYEPPQKNWNFLWPGNVIDFWPFLTMHGRAQYSRSSCFKPAEL